MNVKTRWRLAAFALGIGFIGVEAVVAAKSMDGMISVEPISAVEWALPPTS